MKGDLYQVFYLNEEEREDSVFIRAESIDELALKISDKGIQPRDYIHTEKISNEFPNKEKI